MLSCSLHIQTPPLAAQAPDNTIWGRKGANQSHLPRFPLVFVSTLMTSWQTLWNITDGPSHGIMQVFQLRMEKYIFCSSCETFGFASDPVSKSAGPLRYLNFCMEPRRRFLSVSDRLLANFSNVLESRVLDLCALTPTAAWFYWVARGSHDLTPSHPPAGLMASPDNSCYCIKLTLRVFMAWLIDNNRK